MDAKEAFDAFASGRGADIGALSADEAVDLMLAWYVSERADDVNLQASGDMLLYQWGTYDWGDGPSFQFDITRQLISVAAQDDDDIWQLSLTLHLAPTEETREVGSGNRWCELPAQAEEFRSYIDASAAVAYARSHRAVRISLEYFEAG